MLSDFGVSLLGKAISQQSIAAEPLHVSPSSSFRDDAQRGHGSHQPPEIKDKGIDVVIAMRGRSVAYLSKSCRSALGGMSSTWTFRS